MMAIAPRDEFGTPFGQAGSAAARRLGTPFGQAGSAPKTTTRLEPTVTIGGAPAGYRPVTPKRATPGDFRRAEEASNDTGPIVAPEYTPTPLTETGEFNTGAIDEGNDQSEREDAYQRLFDEFNALGLGALVSDAKDLLMKATSIAAMPDALRGTQAYRTRFSANDARIAKGLSALSPAAYLRLEDSYQNIMRQYGLPASYYTVGKYGKQEGFEKLLANDVSSAELEDRVLTAQQRVLNANPEVLKALKQFYPDLNNGDILAYTLDPTNAIQQIKQKVTAAEIQGAADIFGLNRITAESTPEQIKALEARAQALAGYGVDKAAATEGFAQVAEIAPRGSQLADIYKETPYTQGTAEAEVFNTSGAAQAKAQRKKLKSLEEASFGGSSGVGALGRDRAAYGATSGQAGLY
jgi:hypothetical protein